MVKTLIKKGKVFSKENDLFSAIKLETTSLVKTSTIMFFIF